MPDVARSATISIRGYVRHWFSNAAVGRKDLWEISIRQKPSARRAGEVQFLGEMPWEAGRLQSSPTQATWCKTRPKSRLVSGPRKSVRSARKEFSDAED